MLVLKPVEDPLRRMPLLPVDTQVITQPAVDDRLEPIQPRRPLRQRLAGRWPRRLQGSVNGPIANPVLLLESTIRQPLACVTSDSCVQLHPRVRHHSLPEHHPTVWRGPSTSCAPTSAVSRLIDNDFTNHCGGVRPHLQVMPELTYIAKAPIRVPRSLPEMPQP